MICLICDLDLCGYHMLGMPMPYLTSKMTEKLDGSLSTDISNTCPFTQFVIAPCTTIGYSIKSTIDDGQKVITV
jgi:hypothetical protein